MSPLKLLSTSLFALSMTNSLWSMEANEIEKASKGVWFSSTRWITCDSGELNRDEIGQLDYDITLNKDGTFSQSLAVKATKVKTTYEGTYHITYPSKEESWVAATLTLKVKKMITVIAGETIAADYEAIHVQSIAMTDPFTMYSWGHEIMMIPDYSHDRLCESGLPKIRFNRIPKS